MPKKRNKKQYTPKSLINNPITIKIKAWAATQEDKTFAMREVQKISENDLQYIVDNLPIGTHFLQLDVSSLGKSSTILLVDTLDDAPMADKNYKNFPPYFMAAYALGGTLLVKSTSAVLENAEQLTWEDTEENFTVSGYNIVDRKATVILPKDLEQFSLASTTLGTTLPSFLTVE